MPNRPDPADLAAPRYREAILHRERADRTERTVPLSFSSEYPLPRGDYIEVLDHSRVDLSRAERGLPLIIAHDGSQLPVGVVERVRVDGDRCRGVARFGSSQRADEVFRDVLDGIVTAVSMGYRTSDPIRVDDTTVRFAFTPYEVSLTPVPADPTVGIGRSLPSPERTSAMPQNTSASANGAAAPQPGAPLDERAEVVALVRRHALPAEFAADLERRGVGLDAARREILDELVRRDHATGGHRNVNPDGHRIIQLRAGELVNAAHAEQMQEALAARMCGRIAEVGNPYRHARVVDMARELLEVRGIRTTGMSHTTLVERGLHVTGDFPELLQGAGQRVLRQAYQAAPSGTRLAWRASTARDFRAKSRLMLGEAPELRRVNEHGEFTFGTMVEARESYALGTFGRIMGLTRQALINDDLDAFGDLALRMGRAAAEFEATHLQTLLTSNPVMSDSLALFHASHGNLATGAGSALSLDSLAAARRAMRLQRGLSGQAIDVTPRFLIVPAALEQAAFQFTSSNYVPATPAAVNINAGRLEVIVDPRLDAVSTTAWYLAADPATIDTVEYSYLEGEAGPIVTTSEGFEVDGVRMRVRLDFGAGVLDWRGLYRANGA